MAWKQPQRLPMPSIINSPCSPSSQTLRAVAGFGIVPQHTSATDRRCTKPTNEHRLIIDSLSGTGSAILLSGASGSGKSSLLRGIEQALRSSGRPIHVVSPASSDSPNDHRSIIDLLVGPLESRLDTLAHAGLAEPRLWALPPSRLSVGERARFGLAQTMSQIIHQTAPTTKTKTKTKTKLGDVILADEFATPLDRLNAQALCAVSRRWSRRLGVTLIAAGAHEDLESFLEPEHVFDCNTNTIRRSCAPAKIAITIEPGTASDYHALAHLHYLAGPPATMTRIVRAMRTCPISRRPVLAGALVVSMPTLNSAWRKRAWPGIFNSPDRRHNAKMINTHLRCLSRVIVDPRSRGLGIASMLVRHYLSNPDTAATEAIASMGSACPFFERAGMTPYRLYPNLDDLRLLDALDAQGLQPDDLIDRSIKPGGLLAKELTRWAKSRHLVGAGVPESETIQSIAPIAACRLLAKPRAYAHVATEHFDKDE